MQCLIKFTFLASIFCLNLFAFSYPDVDYGKYLKSGFPLSGDFIESKPADVEILTSEYLRYDNVIYKYSISYNFFDYSLLKSSGFFAVYNSGNFSSIFRYDSDFGSKRIACEVGLYGALNCYLKNNLDDPNMVIKEFSYYESYSLTRVGQCNSDENFNTSTQKCQSCPSGQSWNPQTNSCFTDCTDEKTNKWGWSDGSCTDCSAAKTDGEVFKCFCGSLGLGVPETFESLGVMGKPGYFQGKCSDGNVFEFKSPDYKPDPKPDDNKTKPDDPKPNPDDPKPDPGGDSGGGNSGGGSGGGNSGDSQDNPKPNPGGGSGDNPDPKPNPNPGGGSGGGNNGGKDDGKNKDGEAKFNKGDFDDGDLEKERNSLYNGIVKHINDNLSKFDGIREGVDQFLKNVQGKGFETVKTSIKSKCPMKKEIPLPNGGSKDITVDLCEYVSPASEISYYAFYVGFAVGGFLLFLKLLIFSF